LLHKNLKIKQLSKKLDYVKIRLFAVKEVKGLVNYKLDLLQSIKIHLVFYILVLKLALLSAELATKVEVKEYNKEFKVKDIRDL